MMLWAVLQLAVPTIAVAADAAAATASVGAHAHVEATTDASCIRVHDAECVFCQLLATGAAPSAGPVPEMPPVAEVAPAMAALVVPRRAGVHGIASPRAPPVV